jgi:hypothetical protein
MPLQWSLEGQSLKMSHMQGFKNPTGSKTGGDWFIEN